jgi:protein SCO1/2
MQRRTALLSLAALAPRRLHGNKPQFKAVDITGADYAKDFPLPDPTASAQLKDFAGKVVVVFFGYTQCPDVCPTTMAEIAQVKKLLGADGDKVQGVFITVDPERDTPELLKAYMGNFDPAFVACAARPEQTARGGQGLQGLLQEGRGKTPGSYTMDHSAASYVYDPQGRLRLYNALRQRPAGAGRRHQAAAAIPSGRSAPASRRPGRRSGRRRLAVVAGPGSSSTSPPDMRAPSR